MPKAEELYSQIACGINITASLPDGVKQYLERILDGDIKNALGRLDQPLINPKKFPVISFYTTIMAVCKMIELLINRQDVKSKMSKENVLNNNETDRVQNWISVPNNSPSKNNKKITDYILYKNYTNAIMPLSYIRQPFASLRGRKNNIFS
ncbi:hypothetical protein RhiirC2_735826 [Rhizophagus irregularis]|uniref:Uncharacterized protein n=1 Tax=Rhizophagus irregularis TaxID=588596 RepID=A0A2N1NPI2_9GLOM|nr:hypothetical protein RhiirC2_735826 [Rhizophagus irregularis]